MSWQPTASLTRLREAARLRQSIRDWMQAQQILEVITPSLSQAAATDPHVLSLQTTDGRYLHTSPEFPMKRLLAAHSTDLYQIATVFRAEEAGRFHNTEFTMLEWYRVGMDHHALIADLQALLRAVWQSLDLTWPGLDCRSYGEEIRQRLGVWPEALQASQVAAYFAEHDRSYPAAIGDDLDAALDLFVDEFVLPTFPAEAFTVLMDYPVSQAALARIGQDDHGRAVAQRFELYFGKIELANGFHELAEADRQRARFRADLVKREALGVPAVPIDENLLQALGAGLPDCAGIALGLERLQMVSGGHDHIRKVRSFDDARA